MSPIDPFLILDISPLRFNTQLTRVTSSVNKKQLFDSSTPSKAKLDEILPFLPVFISRKTTQSMSFDTRKHRSNTMLHH